MEIILLLTYRYVFCNNKSIVGRKTIARSLFETFFFCFLFLLLPAHAETEYKPVKGEITGINEKTIQIDTEEPLKPGEKISLVRDGKTTAVCEVVKIQGNSVIAEILEQIGEPDFDDTIMTVVEVKPPAEEKPKEPTTETKPETKTETKSEETKQPENVKPETPVTPPEAQKEEIAPEVPVTPVVTEKPKEETKVAESTAPKMQNENPPQNNSGKKFSFNLGYSAFGPQGIEFSKSGYLAEVDFKIQSVPGLFLSLQYAAHKWSGASTDLTMNIISVDVHYPIQKLPLAIANIVEPYVVAGVSTMQSSFTQNGVTTSKSLSGLNYGFSLLIKRLIKVDYKFHSFSATFGNAKISGGEQVSFSIAPLKF